VVSAACCGFPVARRTSHIARFSYMLTYEALNKAALRLYNVLKDKRFAFSAAEMLLMHALKINREKLYMIYRDRLPVQRQKKFFALIKRRVKGEPLQYILGAWWFYGREFIVKKGVLIPRQDTEALIEAVKSIEHALPPGTVAADAGCGTGIIGITLKLEIPALNQVYCIDTNPSAVKLTGANAVKNGASVKAVHGDFFAFAAIRKQRFGLVVSNPPYVAKDALKSLQKEVKREPVSALAAGKQGLYYYLKFAGEAHTFLENKGFLVLEIGDKMGRQVRKLFEKPEWHYMGSFNDFRCVERAMVFRYLR
jgi:release factor glutamine methyltransferase